MKVKIKKLVENAVIPQYAKPGDCGMDITAISKVVDEYGNISYGTGLAFEIPENYVGLLFPRSSITKFDLTLSNSIGVIDSGYRGEVIFKFRPASYFWKQEVKNISSESFNRGTYNIGDRIGQIIILPYPQIEFEEVNELSTTERGTGGFGSSGN